MLDNISSKNIKIELVNTDGKIIFSYSCEDNNMQLTLNQAKQSGIAFDNLDLSNTDLSEQIITDMHFNGLYICNSDMKWITFKNVIFENCEFSHSDMSCSHFINCKFVNSVFNSIRADITLILDSYYDNVRCMYSDLLFMRMKHSVVKNCYMVGNIFKNGILDDSSIINCNLKQTDLAESLYLNLSLMNTSFDNVALDYTYFDNFSRVSDIIITNTDFEKARFGDKMICNNVRVISKEVE